MYGRGHEWSNVGEQKRRSGRGRSVVKWPNLSENSWREKDGGSRKFRISERTDAERGAGGWRSLLQTVSLVLRSCDASGLSE